MPDRYLDDTASSGNKHVDEPSCEWHGRGAREMNAPSVRPYTYADVTPSITSHPQRDLATLGAMRLEVSALAGFLTASLNAVLGWRIGDVLELDRAATEPVDLLAHGMLVGRGHIVIVDDEISVRVAEIVDGRSELI